MNLPQSPLGDVCTRGPKPSAVMKIKLKKSWQTSHHSLFQEDRVSRTGLGSTTSGYKLLWAHCSGSICDNYDEL